MRPNPKMLSQRHDSATEGQEQRAPDANISHHKFAVGPKQAQYVKISSFFVHKIYTLA